MPRDSHTDISKSTVRAKLVPRREPYWARLAAGLYVGFRKPEQGDGTWIARRRNDEGKQEYHALGTVDDFDKAARQVRAWAESKEHGVVGGALTVKDACEHYVKHLKLSKGANSAADAEGRFRRLIDSEKIGKVELAKLRTSDIKAWLSAQLDIDDEEDDEEDLRRAKDSANRNLASLKAALNLAMHDRLVSTDAGWKTVRAFKDVGRRRMGYVPLEQRTSLMAACPTDLRNLVKAMLLTGARPGELAKLTVNDFEKGQRTAALAGKTGFRIVTLSTAASAFFEEMAKSKIGNAPLLTQQSGQPWNKDAWKKVFRAAVKSAELPDDVVMYSLRHTAISEMIASGMDSFVVARLAGTSTAMIDKHYGHLRHDATRARLDAVQML
jgi:integrase